MSNLTQFSHNLNLEKQALSCFWDGRAMLRTPLPISD